MELLDLPGLAALKNTLLKSILIIIQPSTNYLISKVKFLLKNKGLPPESNLEGYLHTKT